MAVDDTSGLPKQALGWAESAVPSAIAAVAPLGGGITHTKWILTLATGGLAVLRWSDPTRWGAVGRDHVRKEALAHELLRHSALPVPELVASDLDGERAGGPAILMTWRPGRTRLDPLGPEAIGALARSAVAVHQHSVPTSSRPPVFTFRGQDQPEVPGWARRPDLWQRAIDLFGSGAPSSVHGLLHGDLHFGNTLWQQDQVTGLIDWAETSWGPPDLDVAHLCSDFAMVHAPTDARTFRAAYRDAGGQLDPDPEAARFWIVSDIVGFLPDPAHILPVLEADRPDLTSELLRHRLEGLLELTLDG